MNKKIMTVDDSNLMVSVIKSFIGKEAPDFEVIIAKSGEEALEKYISERPDLVFMDIKMPGMDGFEVMEKILGINSGAKVVMCTALKEEEQEHRAKVAGAVGYIRKPFTKEEIANALKLI